MPASPQDEYVIREENALDPAQRIVVNLSSRYVGADDARFRGAEIWSADDVRTAFSGAKLLSSFRRFDSVQIVVDDRRALLSVKPQLAARLMARRDCSVVDDAGNESLGWTRISAIGLRAFRDAIAMPSFRRAVDAKMSQLEKPAPAPALGSGPPLYLRGGLWYGVKAGGSVGHIAGVLKGLADIGLPPVFATTEAVPTVPAGTPTIYIAPKQRQLLQSEWQQLLFNLELVDQIEGRWQGAPPKFVYQRHGLDLFGGLELARRFGVPFVLEYNGPEVWVAKNWGRPLVDAERAVRAESLVLRQADLVVAISDVLADDLRASGIPETKILVLPNAADTALYTPMRDGADFRARYKLVGKTVIGFIGTFGPWHGVQGLVESFGRLIVDNPAFRESVRLLLVGDGATMGAIRQTIATLSIADVTVLTGLLPQSEGPDAVAAFDIAVAPTVENLDGTRFFGSPTKLFEYLAAGKAIVASQVGQVAQIIRHEANGLLVPAGDPVALAEALSRLIRDASLRHTLAGEARVTAENHHTHGARATLLLKTLQRLH